MSVMLQADILRRFTPFSNLGDELLQRLIKNIHTQSLAMGQCLFAIGDNDLVDYFLISGKVRLINKSGDERYIEAGLPHSNQALSPSRPRYQTAIADSEISFFSVNSALLELLFERQKKSTDPLSLWSQSHRFDRDGESLFQQFQHDLSRGYVNLPSFPEVALKIRDLIDQSECDITRVVNLAYSDPGIATKLIKTANSPLYRGVTRCDDLLSAVMRLGLMTTKQLVVSFAILSLFDSSSPLLKQQLEQLRQKTIVVASYGFVLAEELPGFNPEEVLLSALMHQLGKIMVLSYADQFHQLDNDGLLLSYLIVQLRDSIAAIAVETWRFSPQLLKVLGESNQPLRQSKLAFDYCDLIIVAKQLAIMDGNIADLDLLKSVIPAFRKIHKLMANGQTLSDLLTAKADQFKAVQALFLH